MLALGHARGHGVHANHAVVDDDVTLHIVHYQIVISDGADIYLAAARHAGNDAGLRRSRGFGPGQKVPELILQRGARGAGRRRIKDLLPLAGDDLIG